MKRTAPLAQSEAAVVNKTAPRQDLLLRELILAGYVAAALWVYGQRELADIHQVTWIPAPEYLVVFVLAGLIGLGLWLVQQLGGSGARQDPVG